MKYILWRSLGMMLFWLLWPLIRLYIWCTPARSRLLIIHEGSVLLVQNWLGAGQWSLPGGGVHKNEDPRDAVIREVREELGFDVQKRALVDHGVFRGEDQILLQSKFHLFSAVIIQKPALSLQALEIMQAEWVPIAEIDQRNDISNIVVQSVETWITTQNLV